MSIIFRFLLGIIPTTFKERLVAVIANIIHVEINKSYIQEFFVLQDQKIERMLTSVNNTRSFVEDEIDLIWRKLNDQNGSVISKSVSFEKRLNSLDKALTSGFASQNDVNDYYSDKLSKQILLSESFRHEMDSLYQANLGLEGKVLNYISESKIAVQMMNSLREQQKLVCRTLDNVLKINSDEVLTEEEYSEWELQFDKKGDKKGDKNSYLDFLSQKMTNVNGNVLEIGCGTGSLLMHLSAKGANVKGIELSSERAAICKKLGIEVADGDAEVLLNMEPDDHYDIVYLIHVIEHLCTSSLRSILENSFKKLKKGGSIFIETPNVQSLHTLSRYYYMDSTHKSPRHPALIKFVLEKVGFDDVFLSFSDDIPKHFVFDSELNSDLVNKLNDLFFSGGGNIYLEGTRK